MTTPDKKPKSPMAIYIEGMDRRLDEARDAADRANKGLHDEAFRVDGLRKEIMDIRTASGERYSKLLAVRHQVREDHDALKKLQNISFASSVTSALVFGICARTLLVKTKDEPFTGLRIYVPLGLTCAAGAAFMGFVAYYSY